MRNKLDKRHFLGESYQAADILDQVKQLHTDV